MKAMSESLQINDRACPADFVQDCMAHAEPHWYAIYTASRHEKLVARQLDGNGVDHFLPLYRTVRHWKDRRKELDLPLFPGYVFVRIAIQDRFRVQTLPGVVQIVSFSGQPAPVPGDEIEALRAGLAHNAWLEPHPYLKVGRRVRVCRGPMAGLIGILVRKKESFRVVLSVDLIMQSVALEVGADDVEPATSAGN